MNCDEGRVSKADMARSGGRWAAVCSDRDALVVISIDTIDGMRTLLTLLGEDEGAVLCCSQRGLE